MDDDDGLVRLSVLGVERLAALELARERARNGGGVLARAFSNAHLATAMESLLARGVIRAEGGVPLNPRTRIIGEQ